MKRPGRLPLAAGAVEDVIRTTVRPGDRPSSRNSDAWCTPGASASATYRSDGSDTVTYISSAACSPNTRRVSRQRGPTRTGPGVSTSTASTPAPAAPARGVVW
ncbi:hypothetical protein ACFV2Q_15515 [Streptomyces sp. NPDC059650]|uniref:hypothetical protein n=1 Tax=Streptomyces sp. NPDC059650 TaxID=3346896 RepID=UPI0036B729E3